MEFIHRYSSYMNALLRSSQTEQKNMMVDHRAQIELSNLQT